MFLCAEKNPMRVINTVAAWLNKGDSLSGFNRSYHLTIVLSVDLFSRIPDQCQVDLPFEYFYQLLVVHRAYHISCLEFGHEDMHRRP